ncbi:NUDIX domain-containing protein [Altererythrobacter sp. SALINAS58]|uniref:NUDIX domain-containing protein n=1 Tax=Alteripontixanthobacter muriae TaxID=2705546 RepID=UPI0015760F84|nr:NUDIX domain-containing protein [Alteripontixanthobacter muriae]NTZ42629.1 NUDIX domain-containing protein [Alteripontixanthobacter muriae]
MLRLIPDPLFRSALRLADRLRKKWWQVTRPTLLGVSAVAENERGEVLMVRLSYGRGYWSFPGGGCHKGEGFDAAAHRELLEETGCRIPKMELLGSVSEDLHGASNIVAVFGGKTEDMPRIDHREVMEARFFPVDAPPSSLTPVGRRRLDLYREWRK